MGPASVGVIVLLWLLAAAAMAASIVFWRRLAAAGIRPLLGRIVTQLVVVITIVVAGAATMNQHYAFYTTWSDVASMVTGTPEAGGHQSRTGTRAHARVSGGTARHQDAAIARRYRAERARTQARLHLKDNPGPTGQFVTVTVPGLAPAAGHGFRAGRVVLWLPPSYTDRGRADRTYPVIEAFHGTPGGPRDWHRVDHLENVLAQASRDHTMGQAIVVMPDYGPGGLDTECVNGGGINMETWLTRDVPRWVIAHLRARPSASAWATLGYSAGGWCAAMAGLLHPDRYGAAIILGGYFSPEFSNWRPYAHNPPKRYDLLSLARRNPPATNVWIQVSTSDPQSGPASARFVRDARAPLSVTAFTQHDAGHRIGVFMAVLPRALTWLGATLPAFADRAPSQVSPPDGTHPPSTPSRRPATTGTPNLRGGL